MKMVIMERTVTVKEEKMHQLKVPIWIEQPKVKAIFLYSLALSLIPEVLTLFQTHMNLKVMNLTNKSNNQILFSLKLDFNSFLI